jgi:hypothetical protein
MNSLSMLILENVLYIAIFLLCMVGVVMSYKHNKTIPGADLLTLGFLVWGMSGLMAWATAGFNGSYILSYCHIGMIDGISAKFAIAYALRGGLILVIIGIFKMARGPETQEVKEVQEG